MGLFDILQKGAGKVNDEYWETYQLGLTMEESELRRMLHTHSVGKLYGYTRAYKEKYGRDV